MNDKERKAIDMIMRTADSSFESEWQKAFNQLSGQSATARPSAAPSTASAVRPRATAKPPSIWKEVNVQVPSDWVPFSEVFGFEPPSGNDRYGPVYQPETFPAGLRSFIPVADDDYFLPPDETEAMWNEHIDGGVVWLHGQSGTGKSSLEEQFCARIGQPFLRFNGREDVESGSLFGMMTVESGENGGTVWKDGLLTEGVKYGARVLIDEATLIPAGIMMGLQWLLEKGGKLMLTDKPAEAGERLVTPDPRFRLTFADNTRGQGDSGRFNGTGIMNTATLNRINLTLEIKYLKPDQELSVLIAKFGDRIGERVLKDIITVANSLRRAMAKDEISLAFSLRSIQNVLNKAYNYRTMNPGDALRRGFMEGYANLLPNDDEQGAALEIFKLTFGSY